MFIGERFRSLREQKKLTQGDIEKRTSLLRPYVSRIEHGHTVPSISTLEKLARALDMPLYQLFYEGEGLPELPKVPQRKRRQNLASPRSAKDLRFLLRLRRLWSRIDERDRHLLLQMAQKMARRKPVLSASS